MSDERHRPPDLAAGASERARDGVEERLQGGNGAVAGRAAPFMTSDDLTRIVSEELRVSSAVLARELREIGRPPLDALPSRVRRALVAIEQQTRVVARLSQTLRELAALDHADPQPRGRDVDVGAILHRVVEQRTARARTDGIRLEVVTGQAPVLLPADPDRLARGVDAAMEALWRAIGRGGGIRLLLKPTSGGARIDVEGRFAGLRRPRRRLRVAGAPLAIARKIAALHGGVLDLVQDGDTLSIRLALRDSLDRPAIAEASRTGGPVAGKARILVVDDDQDAREALSMILGDDHEVLLAADGHEALQHAMEDRPDVVLMDLYMPRMDGLAALEALRAEPLTEDVPVILISARGDELTRSRCLDLGAVDFLQKPFSGRELKARIERTLRATRRETELQALARTDPLTGLANLRAFRDRLEEEVKRARRYHTSLSCVMVDMDNLKPINDQFGHAAGDQAIRAVADVLRHELRETDFAARYGGDEFVLLLPHTSGAEARVFAERVCSRLAGSPLDVDGKPIPLGASFGIAALVEEPIDRPGETLVRRADAALYAAKRAGRGCVAAHPSADPSSIAPTA